MIGKVWSLESGVWSQNEGKGQHGSFRFYDSRHQTLDSQDFL